MKQNDLPFTHADFLRLACAEFPALVTDFAEDENTHYMQMHSFTRLAQEAKGRGDWDVYKRCMRIATTLWSRPDSELLNELNVAFLEHLDFDGPRGPEAWSHLSSELQHGWRAMKAANNRVAALTAPPRKVRQAKPRKRRR
jgi:hypothetical protein